VEGSGCCRHDIELRTKIKILNCNPVGYSSKKSCFSSRKFVISLYEVLRKTVIRTIVSGRDSNAVFLEHKTMTYSAVITEINMAQ
jgi:hypothetical protein